jgi:hypothetical protein
VGVGAVAGRKAMPSDIDQQPNGGTDFLGNGGAGVPELCDEGREGGKVRISRRRCFRRPRRKPGRKLLGKFAVFCWISWVWQRIANPCTPVQIREGPFLLILHYLPARALKPLQRQGFFACP